MRHCNRMILWSFLCLVILILCVLQFIPNRSFLPGKFRGKANAQLSSKVLKEEVNLLNLPPFQPSEAAEFPFSTTSNKEPRIQHIIHQIFCYDEVPVPYKGFIQTFINQNPTWEYRYWSHFSGWQFLHDHLPELLNAYDHFGLCDEKKTHILKYAVLHVYGGIYVDLDMENLRPLDKVTLKYSCIVPIEPFEQRAMAYQETLNPSNFESLQNKLVRPTLQSDIILCRANHTFLKLCMKYIQRGVMFTSLNNFDGGSFITDMFIKHNELTNMSIALRIKNQTENGPYFYRGDQTEDGNESVYIPNSQYFYDSVDPIYLNKKTGKLNRCWNYNTTHFLSLMGKLACREFELRGEVRKNRNFTFVVHHWHKSKRYDYKRWIDAMKKIPITDVVPKCKLYPWNKTGVPVPLLNNDNR